MGTNKKLVAALGILILAGSLLVATNPALAGATWKGYTYNSSIVNAGAAGMVRIGKEVEKETSGDLKIQVHLGGSLPIKATNITQAVADGVIQFAADGFFLGNITIGGVLRLPMLLTNMEDYLKAVEIMKPYLDRDFAKQGILVLGRYHYPLQVSWSIKKLTCLADMAGQKMRVTSPEQGEYVKRFGAFPVTIGAPEVASALQRGVVDGVFTASAGGGKVWGDLLKYNYRLGPNYFNSVIIVNKKSFDKLSPKTQEKLREIVGRVEPAITAQMKREESEVTEKLKKQGMVVTEARPEDIAEAAKKMADFWEQWAKAHGPEHIEALAKVRKAVGK